MNFRTDASLPPKVKTQAEVIACDAIDIEPFVLGTEYRDELRRKVEHMLKFCPLFLKLFFAPTKGILSPLGVVDVEVDPYPIH
jgi:hypothetical protein